MQFSDSEQALLARLRREERSWNTIRLVSLLCSCNLLFEGISGVLDSADRWPLLLLATSLYGFWYTARNWQGRPEARLLLKLSGL